MKVIHLKRADFYVILGAAFKALDTNPKLMEVSYTEVPDQLLPAARVIQGSKRTNISFIE